MSKQKQQIGNRNYRRKRYFTLDWFGIQGCLERERESMGISVSLELESLLSWAMRGMVVEGVGLGTIFCVGMFYTVMSTKKYRHLNEDFV